jgi:hypothetical protein
MFARFVNQTSLIAGLAIVRAKASDVKRRPVGHVATIAGSVLPAEGRPLA